MAASDDLIDFDLIEGQKENIQALPGGRSAKKLAELYSPSPLHKLATPTPTDTKNINDCIRAEYEAEVATLSESDDPLDVFDRYVRWTLDAYPSAQATPQSQLHTLLERATKAFISSTQYKNDPRYLKLWMHYIHFFSDSPRETYMFLSRHSIGESLALFYEEYSAWLESVGRWSQAEEVYKLGIEREARPVARLLRKFKEFEERRAQLPEEPTEPSSPALPTVRPALAAKVDPFGAAARPHDPQAPRQGSAGSGASRPAKSKLAIFSDADTKAPVLSTKETGPKGWDTIGSLSDRKKENTVEAKPWVGETLKAGGKKPAAAKMSVFRDKSLSQIQNIVVVPSKSQVTVHPQTGKRERIFVDLAVVYPTPEEAGTELSFEEIIAANRGWLDHTWEEDTIDESMIEDPVEEMSQGVAEKLVIHQDTLEQSGGARVGKLRIHQDTVEQGQRGRSEKLIIHQDTAEPSRQVTSEKLAIHQDEVFYDENGEIQKAPSHPRGGKKKKVMEVNETQIIKAKLDSPSRPKMRKKNTSEPTMTIHTRAATDDIYDIFNAPLKDYNQNNESGDDGYMTDGDYTTDGESTGTTRHIEEEERDGAENDDDEASDAKSLSEWSDFSPRRHVPDVNGPEDAESQGQDEDEVSNLINPSQPPHSQGHTQGDEEEDWIPENEDLVTPITDSPPRTRTVFVPVPPEDYEPPTRPYRDPVEAANNRLPFMTPITERTEVSLEVDVDEDGPFKTPSRYDGRTAMRTSSNYEPFSSPIREIIEEDLPVPRVPNTLVPLTPASERKPLSAAKSKPHKGPIIKETLCNPVDEVVRAEILEKMHPPLSSYDGFYDHRDARFERGGEIRKFIKASTRGKGNSDRTSQIPEPVVLELPGACSAYTVRRELGVGAFAPVYLVENSAPDGGDEHDEDAVVAMGKGAFAVHHRSRMEALKMETPPTPWEFHMMRIAHSRLGPQHRASASLSYAHEMHLYQDEAFLFLPYHPHGTLLDVINLFRAESSGVMDEQLAMFFTIELLRTVEALHGKSVLHGDLKPDNCLLRLDALADGEQSSSSLTSQWNADGSGGWSSRGVVLIDFGRGTDMRAFTPEAEFIADWKTTAQDCAEMREGRPWTWQIDYHGLAGTIHTLLFGKYIETTRADAGGALRGGRRYRIKESLKRYWQTELWGACFDMLLNPGAWAEEREDGGKMPLNKGLKEMREGMEAWLGQNCERGVGLKALIGRVESYAKSRK